MIGAVLSGGLGNVFFQIANIEYLGKKYKHDVVYMNPSQWIDNSKNPALGWSINSEKISEFLPNVDIFKNASARLGMGRQVNVPFQYREIIPSEGFIYNGYFQSEKFFPNREFIKHLLEPSKEVRLKMIAFRGSLEGLTTCSVHVRRGDYVRQQQFHPLQDPIYYDRAMELLDVFATVDKYIVFSNDIPWCKENFTGDKFVFVEDLDYVELFLMDQCNHHIMANSSFSWWGSWLGETPDTVTICPKNWFGSALPDNEDADIIPERWFRL
jgi:hypothetical protein